MTWLFGVYLDGWDEGFDVPQLRQRCRLASRVYHFVGEDLLQFVHAFIDGWGVASAIRLGAEDEYVGIGVGVGEEEFNRNVGSLGSSGSG